MILETVVVGMVQTNCYVVAWETGGEALVVDPGADPQRIRAAIDRHNLRVKYVVNTHAHFDHFGANADLVAWTGAQLAIHPAEKAILGTGGGAGWFGLPAVDSPAPDVEIRGGEELHVGPARIAVVDTPGHSPGGVSLYLADDGIIFVGDALFAGGVGRTDLPGSDSAVLAHSILDVLLALPDEVIVYPGHGPATTIGREKRSNPWLQSL
ncbi:MAG: MBL fold metallo-hydrolase [Chloroflexi bacterium]|nr:MBL fold metallo-hydrolase [Chloroflexota bacterium]